MALLIRRLSDPWSQAPLPKSIRGCPVPKKPGERPLRRVRRVWRKPRFSSKLVWPQWTYFARRQPMLWSHATATDRDVVPSDHYKHTDIKPEHAFAVKSLYFAVKQKNRSSRAASSLDQSGSRMMDMKSGMISMITEGTPLPPYLPSPLRPGTSFHLAVCALPLNSIVSLHRQ